MRSENSSNHANCLPAYSFLKSTGFLSGKPVDFRKQQLKMSSEGFGSNRQYHSPRYDQPFVLISSQNQKRIETPPVTCLLRTRKHELVKQSCFRHREGDGYKSVIV